MSVCAVDCCAKSAEQPAPLGSPTHPLSLVFSCAAAPVSALTTQFLDWCCARLGAAGKTALLLVWDNASWHVSKAVRAWITANNQTVKQEGDGVRIVVSPLPSKSPWLNPIEAKWVHGKRRIVEPARLLTADKIAERVCAAFDCVPEPHLTIHQQVS